MADLFKPKDWFEGEDGKTNLQMQMRFDGDERFKMDERFTEQKEPPAETVSRSEEEQEAFERAEEKSRALGVLAALLGPESAADSSQREHTGKSIIQGGIKSTFNATARFDPRSASATAMLKEVVQPEPEESEPTKRKRAKKAKMLAEKEALNRPDVSKGVDVQVNSRYRALFPKAEGFESAITREAIEAREEPVPEQGFTFGFSATKPVPTTDAAPAPFSFGFGGGGAVIGEKAPEDSGTFTFGDFGGLGKRSDEESNGDEETDEASDGSEEEEASGDDEEKKPKQNFGFTNKFDDESDEEPTRSRRRTREPSSYEEQTLHGDDSSDDDFVRSSNREKVAQEWQNKRQDLVSDYRQKAKTASQAAAKAKRRRIQ